MKLSLNVTKEQLAKLQELGLVPAEEKPAEKPVESAPVAATSAQAVKDRLTKLGAKVTKADKDGKVGCAFHSCNGRYLPNGIGAWDHTNCEVATPYFTALSAARKAGDDKLYESIVADAKALAEELSAA